MLKGVTTKKRGGRGPRNRGLSLKSHGFTNGLWRLVERSKAAKERQMARAKEESRINAAFSKACSGIPIPVMSITKIYNIGRDALRAGASDVEIGEKMRQACEAVRVG